MKQRNLRIRCNYFLNALLLIVHPLLLTYFTNNVDLIIQFLYEKDTIEKYMTCF